MFVGWVCSRGLLAMKEDPEQQTPPDAAPGSTPSINATFTSRTAGSRSSVSEVVQTYPDLTEIALLCSNATGLLDIEEAHLLFQRQEWRPNIESGMPTLRRFIRPSDWDRIEKMIQNVVNLPPADIDIERRCYFGHPMLFRIPGESRSYLSSNTTSISLAHRGSAVRSTRPDSEMRPDPIHFWMHFSSFDDARIRRPREQELEEIAEGDEGYEDNAQLSTTSWHIFFLRVIQVHSVMLDLVYSSTHEEFRLRKRIAARTGYL